MQEKEAERRHKSRELDISAQPGKTQKNMFLSSKQLELGGKKSKNSSLRENNCYVSEVGVCVRECVHCLALYANVHCTAACLSRKSRNVGTRLSRHVAWMRVGVCRAGIVKERASQTCPGLQENTLTSTQSSILAWFTVSMSVAGG